MKIETMELGYMETDRPATIASETLFSTDHRLKQKGIPWVCACGCFVMHFNLFIAMQAWVLCRLLPFMIGEYIPEDDENWLNYLLMLEIADYLFCSYH